MARKKRTDYVNNKMFYQAMKQYKEDVALAEEQGDQAPRIPKYIGECIYEIATRLSYKPNFIGYPFREDMIADGIENAIMVIDNFDPSKTQNPFGYFTKIIWFAFIRRIQKEKKQLYIKHKLTERTMMYSDDTDEVLMDSTDYMNDFVENYERSMDEKKQKSKQ